MKNILVTGGLGFIGSHTVVELYAAGYTPIIVDNLSNSKKSVLKGILEITNKTPSFYKHDYSDKAFLKKIFEKESIDGVIHFAAHKAVGESIKQPLMYYKNNVAGLIELLQAMKSAKVCGLVFSSSATVYGEPKTVPISEIAPIQPATSPYGSTKQMCETIIRDASLGESFLTSIALRYFNPVGAHPSGKIGELPLGIPANLIPYVTQAAAGILPQLTVHGDDYNTPDGTCIRDYIHVVDLAQAHVKALDYINKQKPGSYEICNVGTGKGNSVLEVLQVFEKVNGVKVPYIIGPRRDGDIEKIYADVAKAKDMLGWQAKKTLAEGLKDAWNWQQKLVSQKDSAIIN